MVGATGAIYAVRKKFLVPLPVGTILDDVFLPLHVVRQGGRVVFEPGARAWDNFTDTPAHEFRRKVRTLTGNGGVHVALFEKLECGAMSMFIVPKKYEPARCVTSPALAKRSVKLLCTVIGFELVLM